MSAYLTGLTVLAVCRSADLVTTWLGSPDLSRELNPIARWMGWRWILVCNAVAIPILPVLPGWQIVAALSVACVIWNVIALRRER